MYSEFTFSPNKPPILTNLPFSLTFPRFTVWGIIARILF
ncbi:hypothetical protein HMPREF1050_0117 [Haemophilus parahaemolyticus HK385]|uniref:Uncharacterized protein n=1 Tax=Haemophilus parahaemolyticus HK385 TaxID=1095744 RepID=A0ABN0F234_HAEPH|nr:hypothetical protein HMPREF1050_0117 [Haemophilus parahaemolyticus HK385]